MATAELAGCDNLVTTDAFTRWNAFFEGLAGIMETEYVEEWLKTTNPASDRFTPHLLHFELSIPSSP